MFIKIQFHSRDYLTECMKKMGGVWLNTLTSLYCTQGVPDEFAVLAADLITDEYESKYKEQVPRGTCYTKDDRLTDIVYSSRSGRKYFFEFGEHYYAAHSIYFIAESSVSVEFFRVAAEAKTRFYKNNSSANAVEISSVKAKEKPYEVWYPDKEKPMIQSVKTGKL